MIATKNAKSYGDEVGVAAMFLTKRRGRQQARKCGCAVRLTTIRSPFREPNNHHIALFAPVNFCLKLSQWSAQECTKAEKLWPISSL